MLVTVSTSKSQYSPSDVVMVLGKVTDGQNNPIVGAGVSIQINDPTGAMIHVQLTYSDSNGAYLDLFTLPQNSAQGQYTVFVSASKAGFNTGQVQTKFSVGTQTTSSLSTSTRSTSSSQTSTSSTPSAPSKCLIATATFGSELAPEVALLRNFRDSQVLQTAAGSSFMLAFNAFYYSFSPQVASYISSHDYVRAGMKVVLYPLIGILYVTNRLFTALSFNMELAVTVSGVFAASAIGAVYLGPIVMVISRLSKNRNISRHQRVLPLILICCAVSIGGILLSELTHQNILLLATTVATVLSSVALGGYAVPCLIKTLHVKKTR
jgi:peptide/nickel transport system substrate-binding protein